MILFSEAAQSKLSYIIHQETAQRFWINGKAIRKHLNFNYN